MPAHKIYVLLVVLVSSLFIVQGCATSNTTPPGSKGAFFDGMRTTLGEIIDTAKIASCEVVSNDCPDRPRDGRRSDNPSG